jgi:isocitrate dehydrogenase kinase/phosphatase
VPFLRTLMPTKPESELCAMLGLHKQGKTMFYPGHAAPSAALVGPVHHRSRHQGPVMLVFTLPSFPYVFKIIKDKRSKDVSREFIQRQYQLVKFHDRVGRMADTWEYSDVPFPKARMDATLIAELREFAPSLLEETDQSLVIRHLYIERRMVPLNMHIERVDPQERERALVEYGDAIEQMVAANIFPGDMLYKNFGVARAGAGGFLRL